MSVRKKQNNDRFLLENITKLIISYEPGDVVKISDIIVGLEKYADNIGEDKPEKRICLRLIDISHKEMTNSSEDFTAVLSEGVDLLQDAADAKGKLPEWKEKRIQDWLSKKNNEYLKEQSTKTSNDESTIQMECKETEENPPLLGTDQLQLFISDCESRFSRAQDLILQLEQEHQNDEAVKELFRIFHTIKGESGFLKLATLGFLTHNMETLLDLLRSGKKSVNEQVIDFLLKGLDLAQELITALKNGSLAEYKQIHVWNYTDSLSRYNNSPENQIPVNDNTAQKKEESDSVPRAEKIQKKSSEVQEPSTPSEDASFAEKKASRAETEEFVIKVKAGKINYLVDMIGELLISLGQMKEDTEGLPQVRKIARTLQYAGMQLRTESVHTLFGTVRRIIRDTSLKVGKQVKTVFEGEDLEIDRNLIESLEEPLMHLIRNAIDHGIESSEERLKAGKPEEGTIRVSAERRGNNIVISIGDDGRGIDRNKILKKAVEKGMIAEKDIPEMTETAIKNLIFTSGFSTNDSVSLISGRGVGMDIVRETVEKAKGHIYAESIPGKGTTFSLFFPLSTAIIDGMMVRTGESIFIIPVPSIIESVKIDEKLLYKIAAGVYVLDLRGEVIPVISLADIFEISPAGKETVATIIENVNKERFAVTSEEILAKREVVIKNLGACFKHLKGISSGTVLPGGSIGFVMDIEQTIALSKEKHVLEEVMRG